MKTLPPNVLNELIEIAGFTEITEAVMARLGVIFPGQPILEATDVTRFYPEALQGLHRFLYVQKSDKPEGDYHHSSRFPVVQGPLFARMGEARTPLTKQALSIPLLKRLDLPFFKMPEEKKSGGPVHIANPCCHQDVVFLCQQRLIAIICQASTFREETARVQYQLINNEYARLMRLGERTVSQTYFCGLFERYALNAYQQAHDKFVTIEHHSGAAFELALLNFNECYRGKKSFLDKSLHMPRTMKAEPALIANYYCSRAVFNAIPNPGALAIKAMCHLLLPGILEIDQLPGQAAIFRSLLLTLKETSVQNWWEFALVSGSLYAYIFLEGYHNKEKFKFAIPPSIITDSFLIYDCLINDEAASINLIKGVFNAHLKNPYFLKRCFNEALPSETKKKPFLRLFS